MIHLILSPNPAPTWVTHSFSANDPVAAAQYVLTLSGSCVVWLPCHQWSDYATYRQYLSTGLFHWIGFFPKKVIGHYDATPLESQLQSVTRSIPVQLMCLRQAREREIFARNYLTQTNFENIRTEQKLWVLEYIYSRQYEQLKSSDSAMFVTLATRAAQFLVRVQWDYASLLQSHEA